MSRSSLSLLRVGAALACAAALLLPSAAQAEVSPARNVEFAVPSLQGNIDVKRVQFNATDKLSAWVRLPAGYDDEPDRQWPVLYLLHGWEDNAGGWLDPKKGALASVLPAGFDGIVVMPEGAKDWFINWADNNANPGHQWGNYLLDEVVPFMESNLRILPGRSNHVIGGLSMGGYGAVRAVAAMPTYFGHALSLSSLLDNQDNTFSTILNIAQITHPGYSSVFGNLLGPYADSLNPLKNPRDFALSRLSLTYGTPAVSTLWSLDIRARGLGTLELGANLQAQQFATALKRTTAKVFTNNRNNGSHDWRWWKQDLRDDITRGLWGGLAVTETNQAKVWGYDTMQLHGNAWGLGFKMLTKPTRKVELTRTGPVLVGRGAGTIRIAGGAADADSSGNGTQANCTFTLKLPFVQALPPSC